MRNVSSDKTDFSFSRSRRTGYSWRSPLARLYVAPLILWLLLDCVPRIFQGDSISYLSTGFGSWMPPDRSWEFGILVNLLLRHTHGLSAFILIQVGVLVVLVEGARLIFPQTPAGLAGWALAAALVALDPLIEIYTRFYLSDFLAMALFLAATAGLVLVFRTDAVRGARVVALVLTFLSILGAIILRVAYFPIMLLTVVLATLLMWRHLTRGMVIALVLAACASILSVGAITGANRVVFAKQFPGETFVNKLSGVFLAGVFAPALKQVDFRNAGIPITSEEFEKLDLSDYEKRDKQVWGHHHTDLQQLIEDNLHVAGAYNTTVNQAAWRLVMSAVRRDPLSFAKVYFVDLFDFAKPQQWRSHAPIEMGLTRDLPSNFVAFVNHDSVLKITSNITKVRSALIQAYEAVAGLYPLQLLLGFLAGLVLLIRTGPRPCVVLPFAAFCADLTAAPLYENYLIARYILATVFLGYLLVGMAVSSFLEKRAAGHQIA